jgi:hypothetical protein
LRDGNEPKNGQINYLIHQQIIPKVTQEMIVHYEIWVNLFSDIQFLGLKLVNMELIFQRLIMVKSKTKITDDSIFTWNIEKLILVLLRSRTQSNPAHVGTLNHLF